MFSAHRKPVKVWLQQITYWANSPDWPENSKPPFHTELWIQLPGEKWSRRVAYGKTPQEAAEKLATLLIGFGDAPAAAGMIESGLTAEPYRSTGQVTLPQSPIIPDHGLSPWPYSNRAPLRDAGSSITQKGR